MVEIVGVSFEQDIQREQNERAVIALWENGIYTPDCVAFHGTSLETIEYLLETGHIPGYSSNNYLQKPNLPQVGDIYFYPRVDTFPFDQNYIPDLADDLIDDPNSCFMNSLKWAITSANDNAVAHHFCRRLGLDISEHGDSAYFFKDDFYCQRSIEGRISREVFNGLNISTHLQSQTLIAARRRRGVVLGLHRKALDELPVSVGDSGDDFRVSPGNTSLHYRYLSGLFPLGVQEEAFFNRLTRKYK